MTFPGKSPVSHVVHEKHMPTQDITSHDDWTELLSIEEF